MTNADRKRSTAVRTLQIYLSYWTRQPGAFAGSLLLAPAYILQNIVSPLFIAQTISKLAAGNTTIMPYMYAAAGTMLAGFLLNYYASHRYEIHLNTKGIALLYDECLRQLMRQDYAFFADNFGGSLVARANRMAKGFETFTYFVFLEVLGLLAGVLVALGIMLYINPLVGGLVIIVWLLSIGIVTWLALHRMPIRREAIAHETKQTGELADIITNAVTVKTFAREAAELRRYEATNSHREALFLRSWKMATHHGFVIQMLCGGLQLIVLVGGVWGVQHGSIAIGTFLLFQVYILRIIDSVLKVSQAVRQFEGILGDAHEMTELFDTEPAVQDPAQPEASRITRGAISLDDVTFTYNADSQAPPLLSHFTMQVKPGEKIGLVGPSGGGKTTLTKLLLRFVDIQKGAVRIDGQDIRRVRQDDLHSAISYVPQEPILFHRSILENIGYGDPGATNEAIIRAAKQAHAHEFISKLPQGYNTLVGERGIKLSGGQRQRIAIARAMLKKAPVLILDEATSALDSESEHYIQDALWKLMQGKTTIVIAHRLSTIQKMDRIIVLDAGAIVEEGAHASLIKRKGTYAKLWTRQSGGFIEE